VNGLKVLFLAPEAVPFAKTGGLADVAGSLPPALRRLGLDVRLVLPLYRAVRESPLERHPLVRDLKVPLGTDLLTADVLETRTEEGVPVYLIDREDLFDRPHLYGDSRGDYYDNLERFSFFCHAALRLPQALAFEPDLLHCHDWQTGLVPALLKDPAGTLPGLGASKTVFTIHNLAYQGLFNPEKLALTGLSREHFFHADGLEYWGRISLLKAGIFYAQAVTTVSPAYAREIQTPEYGAGMEGILRRRKSDLHGILNGVDYRVWDPWRDPHLPVNYEPRHLEGKARCKEYLIHEMGLDPSLKGRPLLALISRLDAQKGLDLLVLVLDRLLDMDLGLVVLGTGEKTIQGALVEGCSAHPGRMALSLDFNDPLAHRIMAGADLFLIPSRYEPCGLTQMYALKYGTPPLVRATGGLDDTIIPFDPGTGEGNGFKFGPYDPEAFLEAIIRALALFKDRRTWKRVMANGMKADFSWNRSATRYRELYRGLVYPQDYPRPAPL